MQQKSLSKPTTIVPTLAASLAYVRRDAGLGVRELSRRSGVDAAQISRIESGKVAAPEYRTLVALARALGRSELALEVLARPEGGDAPGLIGSINDEELAALRLATRRWKAQQWKKLCAGVVANQDKDAPMPTAELLAFARDALVHLDVTSYVVDTLTSSVFSEVGFEIEPVVSGWLTLTNERKQKVLSYIAEQGRLSELDRRETGSEQKEES